MTRNEAISILQQHADEFRARGVTRLALFGSTARNDARPDSDIDVLVDIDDNRTFSLIDLAGLRLFLSDILGHEVEIAERPHLKPYLKENILSEAIEVL